MKKVLSCLIADDEPPACKILEKYVLDTPGLALAGIFYNGQEVVSYLKNASADVLFTDIRMPGSDGIQMAGYLKQLNIKVVIISAYKEFGALAYEKDVVDYLLKPVSYDRFLRAVEKLKIASFQSWPTFFRKPLYDFIFLKADKRLHKVIISEIVFIEAFSNYLSINLQDSHIIVRETMMRMMEKLPKEYFFRVHKSFIVNIHRIKHIEGNRIVLEDREVPLGESYKEAFFTFLGENFP